MVSSITAKEVFQNSSVGMWNILLFGVGEGQLRFFKKILINLFLKRGKETSMCGCLSCAPYCGNGQQPSMCPDWGSNWRLFDSQAGTQSTKLHQPGQDKLSISYSEKVTASRSHSAGITLQTPKKSHALLEKSQTAC